MKNRIPVNILGYILVPIPFVAIGSFIYHQNGIDAVIGTSLILIVAGFLCIIGGLGVTILRKDNSTQVSLELDDKIFTITADNDSEAKRLIDTLTKKGITAKQYEKSD